MKPKLKFTRNEVVGLLNTHIPADGPALNVSGTCVWDNGKGRCVVGALLDDSIIERLVDEERVVAVQLESDEVDSIFCDYSEANHSFFLAALDDIQSLHDAIAASDSPSTFENLETTRREFIEQLMTKMDELFDYMEAK